MKLVARIAALVATLALPVNALADDPPLIEYQPSPCTIPGKPIALCASVTDDVQVAKARVYFRPEGDKFYSFVDMVFGGISFCATLPALRDGKLRAIEYYVQATDSQYQAQRTSTFRMALQPEGVCEFPPIEKDGSRAAAIRVYATNKKQGKKLSDSFQSAGVSFVPVAEK